MAIVRPFKAFRPKSEFAGEVAAKPYDVLSSEEARIEVKDKPYSFLHIGKPEVDLDPNVDIYSPDVYEKGKKNLQKLISNGILKEDDKPYLYIYSQTMDGRTQYGIVGCCSIEDYWNDTIKKHEFTRPKKEADRCEHVRVTNSHSGPIFLTYPDNDQIDKIVDEIVKGEPDNSHMAEDGIKHETWVIRDEYATEKLISIFGDTSYLYVADGHHRTAAAAIVGKERKEANRSHTGDEEYNFFLSVIFPASQLKIFDYNRVVKDLNGLSEEELIARLDENFAVGEAENPVSPSEKGEFGMYLGNKWYVLNADEELIDMNDPVKSLDVAILQDNLLSPILGVGDPRTDDRIDFVGGIRGVGELEKRVDSGEMKIAFSMYPTSIEELIKIADSGNVMPPKSTWFEPKLRDGLFVHFLD